MRSTTNAEAIKRRLDVLSRLGPGLGRGTRRLWLRVGYSSLDSTVFADAATVCDIIGVDVDDMKAAYGSRWSGKFDPLKELNQGLFLRGDFKNCWFISPNDDQESNDAPDDSNYVKKGNIESSISARVQRIMSTINTINNAPRSKKLKAATVEKPSPTDDNKKPAATKISPNKNGNTTPVNKRKAQSISKDDGHNNNTISPGDATPKPAATNNECGQSRYTISPTDATPKSSAINNDERTETSTPDAGQRIDLDDKVEMTAELIDATRNDPARLRNILLNDKGELHSNIVK